MWEATEGILLQRDVIPPLRIDNGAWIATRVPLSNFVGLKVFLELVYRTGSGGDNYYNSASIDDICAYGNLLWEKLTLVGLLEDEPSCSNYFLLPGTGATNITYRFPRFAWSRAGMATSYKLYLGTSPNFNPQSSLVSGYVTTDLKFQYQGELLLGTRYFFKVVPLFGNVSRHNCPTWSFTTKSPIVVFPYTNNFDDGLGLFFNDEYDSGEEYVLGVAAEYGPG